MKTNSATRIVDASIAKARASSDAALAVGLTLSPRAEEDDDYHDGDAIARRLAHVGKDHAAEARIKNVFKSQSCMVIRGRLIVHAPVYIWNTFPEY